MECEIGRRLNALMLNNGSSEEEELTAFMGFLHQYAPLIEEHYPFLPPPPMPVPLNDYLSCFTNLRHLVILNHPMSVDTLAQLLQATVPQLDSLGLVASAHEIGSTRLSDEQLSALAHVQHLDLSQNDFGANVGRLARTLHLSATEGRCRLVSLNLSANRINDQQAFTLLSATARCATLRSLNLACNDIRAMAATANDLDQLRRHPMRSLCLHSNWLSVVNLEFLTNLPTHLEELGQ
jgi:hypothetical protein